jgi:cyclase
MLRSRITPCLLVHRKGLVKTVEFKEPKYVGDPLNAVKIFNEKEVDELIILDIDATIEGRGPDFNFIKNIAIESRMPLCYGGGITTVEQAKKIISLGVEKIALSSAAIENPQLLVEIGNAVGVQSLVVVLDVKKKGLFKNYEVFIHNGKRHAGKKLTEIVSTLNNIGVGEIVINSIDEDGKMNGYDFKLFEIMRDLTSFPLTILGGASSIDNIKEAIKRYKPLGVAAGSIFVFKGKYKAVLINYPDRIARNEIY